MDQKSHIMHRTDNRWAIRGNYVTIEIRTDKIRQRDKIEHVLLEQDGGRTLTSGREVESTGLGLLPPVNYRWPMKMIRQRTKLKNKGTKLQYSTDLRDWSFGGLKKASE